MTPVKTGVQSICNPWKYWVLLGVYPDQNRGRNDMKKSRISFFTPSL